LLQFINKNQKESELVFPKIFFFGIYTAFVMSMLKQLINLKVFN